MKDHINQFEKLREARDFHAPAEIPPLSLPQVNLTFLTSLGKSWNLFHQALGPTAYTMPTGELFARVEAMESINSPAKTKSLNSSDSLALISRIDNRGHARKSNRSNNRFKPYSNSQFKPNSNSIDNDDSCNYCKQPGHFIDDCFKKRWADTQWVQGGKKGSKSKSSENRDDAIPH